MAEKQTDREVIDEGISAQEFKCKACGASLEFNPKTQKFICAHCQTEQSFVISKEVNERDFAEIFKSERWKSAEIKTIRCENCGATEVFQEKEVARSCSFCGSHKVLRLDDFQGLKPNVVIPFKIATLDALKLSVNWLKKRIFSPNKFKKEATIDNIHGVYYPVWTFDSQVNVRYHGRLGKYHTVVTKDSKGNTHTRQEIRWFAVSGTISKIFDDIMINAGKSVEEKWFNKLKPFEQKDYTKYENNFLAGYSASTYSLEPLDAWRRAEEIIRDTMKSAIISKHNADVVQSLNMDVNYEGKSFKYILVPLYTTASYYKNKLYNQYINGANGKICGKAPISPAKVSIAVFAALGLIAVIALLYHLGGG